MTAPRTSVTWVAPDKMGGALNLAASLIAGSDRARFAHHVLLTDNLLDVDTRFDGALAADTQQRFAYRLPVENLYAVLRRLRDALRGNEGVLVANDWLELAAATAFDVGRTVVQVVHGDYDYYYDLAARHDAAVDVFVACSQRIAQSLRDRLPHRANDVVHLPSGVQIPQRPIAPRSRGPLRLLFVGRVASGKGVFDLPLIDAELCRRGVEATWTVVGDGPDAAALRREWTSPRVRFTGALPHAEVLAQYPEHDVFVLPSRAEGFPITLLEAMAAGVVPVISDLPSGVPEIVEPGVTGWLAPVGEVASFATPIAALSTDPARRGTMSAAARDRVAAAFDIAVRVRAYDALFASCAGRRRPRRRTQPMPYGSRLDRPWLPNAAVKAVRTVMRRARGRAC